MWWPYQPSAASNGLGQPRSKLHLSYWDLFFANIQLSRWPFVFYQPPFVSAPSFCWKILIFHLSAPLRQKMALSDCRVILQSSPNYYSIYYLLWSSVFPNYLDKFSNNFSNNIRMQLCWPKNIFDNSWCQKRPRQIFFSKRAVGELRKDL